MQKYKILKGLSVMERFVDTSTLKIGGRSPMYFMELWMQNEWMFEKDPGEDSLLSLSV